MTWCHGDMQMLVCACLAFMLARANLIPLNAHLDSYMSRYDDDGNLNNGRLLVSTTRGTLGLGNRMLAHASAFAYALLTNRTLLVHSPDVDLFDIFTLPSPKMVITKTDYNSLFKKGGFTGSVKRVDASHDATGEDWQQLVCGDLNDNMDAIILNGGQYFLPLLLSKHEIWFRKIFPDFSSVYHKLARFLFTPSEPVRELIKSRTDGFDLGIQLRSFKLRYEKQQDALTQKCIERQSLERDSIFVASLYKQHKHYFKQKYGHADSLSAFELQTNQVEQYQFALAEMYILSQSRALIVSSYSTFGYTALALRDRNLGKVFMLDHRVSCRVVADQEPCFHKAPRQPEYCPDGSLMWPNRDRICEVCPDFHKRGLKFR